MSRLSASLACWLAVIALCQSADAVMCSRCRGKVHDNQFGICNECRGNSRSTATQLCPACSAELVRCEMCRKKLTDVDRASRGSDEAGSIDARKSGDYRYGQWFYRHEVTGLGTSRSKIRGRLAYAGKELPPASINDYYKTPWGYLYWVGDNGTAAAKRGWITSALTGTGHRGRLLTPPQGNSGPVVRLSESDHRREVTVGVGTGILISLRGDSKSGRSWKITKTTGAAVESLSRRPTYAADPGRSGQAGSGGTYSFKLKSVRTGKSTIELGYGKSITAYGRPEKTVLVTIVVQ